METRNDYIINTRTCGIYNEFTDDGDLRSIVVERNQGFKVNTSPLEIIENSLHYYGGSLEGAISGAKKVLGNIDMPPIKICGSLGIYLFPTKAINHKDCAWFAPAHIQDFAPIDKKLLRVTFYGGYNVETDCSFRAFKNKVNTTDRYQKVLERRIDEINLYTPLVTDGYTIVKDPQRNHYYVRKKM